MKTLNVDRVTKVLQSLKKCTWRQYFHSLELHSISEGYQISVTYFLQWVINVKHKNRPSSIPQRFNWYTTHSLRMTALSVETM